MILAETISAIVTFSGRSARRAPGTDWRVNAPSFSIRVVTLPVVPLSFGKTRRGRHQQHQGQQQRREDPFESHPSSPKLIVL
jgi:hypothetical protein